MPLRAPTAMLAGSYSLGSRNVGGILPWREADWPRPRQTRTSTKRPPTAVSWPRARTITLLERYWPVSPSFGTNHGPNASLCSPPLQLKA